MCACRCFSSAISAAGPAHCVCVRVCLCVRACEGVGEGGVGLGWDGMGGAASDLPLVRSQAPGIPLFLSRARREEEAGEQPPDAHIDAQHGAPAACRACMGPAPNVSPPLAPLFLSLSCTWICACDLAFFFWEGGVYVCASAARFCRGRGSWIDRRTVGPPV